jgi:archaellum component FlaC
MTLEVETIVAVSIMMAVFSAVAAVGTSLVLGAGFERLRNGFEVIRKQTGFFSDAIHKLEQKVEYVDKQALRFGESMNHLDVKVQNVGEQANLFSESMQKLEKKVEIVDKQTGFFTDALHRLEQKVEATDAIEKIVSDKIEHYSDTGLISTAKTDAMISHAENLLTQMASLAEDIKAEKTNKTSQQAMQAGGVDLKIPKNLMHFIHNAQQSDGEIRFH